MLHGSDSFNRLAEKYGAPGSVRFVKVLESMVTPEEGDLLLALWSPATFEELARKLNAGEGSLRRVLEEMVRKRVITFRNGVYAAQTTLINLCHATVNLSQQSDEYWTDFFFTEWRYIIARLQRERRQSGLPTFHRILPALQALAASPHIPPEQILWYEDLDALLQRSTDITFSRCVCRAQHHKCDNKVELCMHVSLDGKPVTMPPWVGVRHYSYKEGLDELYAAEDAGMCHLSQNHPKLAETCNCCEDCCRVINPLIYGQPDYDFADPHKSRFQASIDPDLCSGCQTCVERCLFKAVEMFKPGGSKKMKARVIEKKCMGCGLCVYKCPAKAIRFDIVRPPEFIPVANPLFQGRFGM